MTGRAGLVPFAQYINSLGLADNLAKSFPNIKKNNKGVDIKDFFQSMLCWFMVCCPYLRLLVCRKIQTGFYHKNQIEIQVVSCLNDPDVIFKILVHTKLLGKEQK